MKNKHPIFDDFQGPGISRTDLEPLCRIELHTLAEDMLGATTLCATRWTEIVVFVVEGAPTGDAEAAAEDAAAEAAAAADEAAPGSEGSAESAVSAAPAGSEGAPGAEGAAADAEHEAAAPVDGGPEEDILPP